MLRVRGPQNSDYALGIGSLFWHCKEILGFKDFSESLHGVICKKVEDYIVGEEKRNLGIIIPRDMLKSSLGLGTCLWLFVRHVHFTGNYDFRCMIDTSTKSLSTKHIRWIKHTLQSNKRFIAAYGKFDGPDAVMHSDEIYVQQRSQVQSVVREPNFMASAVMAEKTGLHFDFQWYDDLVSERNYSTKDLRQKVVDHFYSSLNLLEPTGNLLYTATPWHDADLTGRLRQAEKERIEKKEKAFISFYVRAAMEDVFGKPDDVAGQSIFPERWPTWKLIEQKDNWPRFSWRAQKMCNPTLPEYSIPYRADEMYVPREKFPARLRLKVVTVDPNFRNIDQRSGDNACIVVGGFDSRANWWGIDVRLGVWTGEQLINELFDIYQVWRPAFFRIEKKWTAHLMEAIRHREQILGVHLNIQLMERDWRSKEMRYVGLHSLFASGRVHFAKELSQTVKMEIEEELERVGSSAHDDFLDALQDQFTDFYPIISEERGIETFPSNGGPFARLAKEDREIPPEALGFIQPYFDPLLSEEDDSWR